MFLRYVVGENDITKIAMIEGERKRLIPNPGFILDINNCLLRHLTSS